MLGAAASQTYTRGHSLDLYVPEISMRDCILHNPRCSKSRETLALLQDRKADPQVIEYLKTPPTKEELRGLLGKLGMKPEQLVRKGEDVYKQKFAGKAMLDVLDLPPISEARVPWAGTEAQDVGSSNSAASNCDRTSFSGNGISGAATRTFVMPESDAPAVFGLTETVARVQSAPGFVDTIRSKLAKCSDDQLANTVRRLADRASDDRDLAIWRVTSDLSDKQSFTMLMGVARVGDAVAQVGFVPTQGYTMSASDFVAVVRRAGERVAALQR